MVLQSRREYIAAIRLRYRQARKRAKSVVLDEFCATCGYNRNYAIGLLQCDRRASQGRSRVPFSVSRPRPFS